MIFVLFSFSIFATIAFAISQREVKALRRLIRCHNATVAPRLRLITHLQLAKVRLEQELQFKDELLKNR